MNIAGPVKKNKASLTFDAERRRIAGNALIPATTLDNNPKPVTIDLSLATNRKVDIRLRFRRAAGLLSRADSLKQARLKPGVLEQQQIQTQRHPHGFRRPSLKWPIDGMQHILHRPRLQIRRGCYTPLIHQLEFT